MKNKYRILLIVDLAGDCDEGIRNIGEKIFEELNNRHHVLALRPRNVFDIIKIIRFRPNIIHSLRGPSYLTFILLIILKYLTGCNKLYSSLLHPSRRVINNLKYLYFFNSINLLTQDKNIEQKFKSKKFKTISIPNGIDPKKYNYNLKSKLPIEIRDKIINDKKYLLHVGHLKSSRGLEIILDILNNTQWGAIVIISKRYSIDNNIYNNLIKSGAIVHVGYLENLGSLYSFSDCYLFPVRDPYGSIDMPLTVLESIACGTPVLSTYYKALPGFLNDKDGVFYYKNKDDLFMKLKEVDKYKLKDFNSRFTWRNIVKLIEKQYDKGIDNI